MIWIPEDVRDVLRTLAAAGHEAWCVGGCVRDLLLGRMPEDWDVTTAAVPEETLRLFGDRAVPTGLRHGTVTVRTGVRSVEVTTYRRDGRYTDHRRPDSVEFSDTLEEDLKRRDFTINAMALSADGALRDPLDGRPDLRAGVLRCVGTPAVRFGEDALRILRCLRFSSVLGFSVEPGTSAALHRERELLRDIAAERIRAEFVKLLCGKNAAAVLREYPDVAGVFLPELLPLIGFDQKNRHHCWDVWEHTLHSVEAVPGEPVLRMTMLLHDVGKPRCFTVDERGIGHFYGHSAASREMAETILRRLRFDHHSMDAVLKLVEWHDRDIPRTEKGVRRALRVLGEENLRRLICVKRADNLAQSPEYRAVQAEIDRGEALLDRLVREDACVSLRALAVNGRDLTALGLRGREIGSELDRLLCAVVDGSLPNEREALLAEARRGENLRENP